MSLTEAPSVLYKGYVTSDNSSDPQGQFGAYLGPGHIAWGSV